MAILGRDQGDSDMWPTPTALRRHTVAVGVTAALVATAAADHVRPRDDLARYNHRTVTVVAAPAGDAAELADGTRVRLIGVADPAPAAAAWLAGHRRLTLLLPAAGTRDGDGAVRAYAFDDDGRCVNVDLVHAGLAYVDRRRADVMAGLLDPAEADARRKRVGLWDGLRFDQQPPWRQAWLAARAAEHRPPAP